MSNFPARVDKRTARKMYEKNVPFIIVPCKCPPYRWTVKKHGGKYELSSLAILVDPEQVKQDFDTFDQYVSSYEYYNCMYEVGDYAAYYRVKE